MQPYVGNAWLLVSEDNEAAAGARSFHSLLHFSASLGFFAEEVRELSL